MALIADDAAHRVEQLLLMTERLAALAAKDTRRIEGREPLIEAETDEKNRLANAYRPLNSRASNKTTPSSRRPPALLDRLRQTTVALHKTLDAHELALNAVKVVSKGWCARWPNGRPPARQRRQLLRQGARNAGRAKPHRA